jgi:Fe-S-cluster-containing dehydrogenase component
MSQYYMLQDTKKCIKCHACEVQCKINKLLPAGPRLCRIIEVGPKSIGSLPKANYIFMSCHHCETPWCVPACPTGAMQRRPKDGIVFVDESLCVGCKSCIAACPWGAPQWQPETGTVVKCDYCKDRLDLGLKPACVTICTSHCLHFGRTNEMSQIRRERHAHQVAALDQGRL